MRGSRARLAAALGTALLAVAACDRKVEPWVPNEQPSQPDLRKIFPRGAEPAERPSGVMGQTGRDASPPAPGEAATAAAAIRGRVSLAPELAQRAPSGAVLFLVARRGASGPPVAVKRIDSPTFPATFEIGPDDRMIQTVPFEGPLLLMARLDADGNASTRSAGDVQGVASREASPGAQDVEIVLDEVL